MIMNCYKESTDVLIQGYAIKFLSSIVTCISTCTASLNVYAYITIIYSLLKWLKDLVQFNLMFHQHTFQYLPISTN